MKSKEKSGVSGVKILWNISSFEGPVSGICKYGKLFCYFYTTNKDDYDTRRYGLIVLPTSSICYQWVKRHSFAWLVVKKDHMFFTNLYFKMFGNITKYEDDPSLTTFDYFTR